MSFGFFIKITFLWVSLMPRLNLSYPLVYKVWFSNFMFAKIQIIKLLGWSSGDWRPGFGLSGSLLTTFPPCDWGDAPSHLLTDLGFYHRHADHLRLMASPPLGYLQGLVVPSNWKEMWNEVHASSRGHPVWTGHGKVWTPAAEDRGHPVWAGHGEEWTPTAESTHGCPV